MSGIKLRPEQVRTLYEQHGPVLLAYGISLLHDRSASEDVLHQVFVKLLQTGVAINGEPLHYLYRAIRNTALNYRRNHSRQLELASNGHWLESPRGMEEIGLALEEAALALDISPNTAASRYRYGLAKLKERLEPLAKE